MKVNQHIRILITFFVIINLNGCDIGPEIIVPTPDIKSNDKIISCNNCNDFGKIIELTGDHMIISDFENVFIYIKEDDTWKLTFENTRTNTSGIQSIKVKDSTMLIGIADARGGGIVEIFEFESDSWDLVNTLSVDRREDNFGSALDIYDDKIIIGSNAQWLDESSNFNEDEGRVYIYESDGNHWNLEAEFEANNSQDDDRFGDAVAIYNNIALAGGRNTEGLHVYRFNGSSWELDSLIDMQGVRMIQHSRNRFLISYWISTRTYCPYFKF